MGRSNWQSLRIVRSAAGPVTSGHPWVFRDQIPILPIGRPVQLIDPEDRIVGWGFSDEGPIAVRVLGRGTPPAEALSEVLCERIRRADAFRWRLFATDSATDCWRVVNGPGDGLPGLVVDRYADVAVVRLYSKAWEGWIPELLRALVATGWPRSVLRRFGVARVDGKEGSELLWGAPVADELVVRERGMRLLVRPKVGQKTGLFLDQRENRARVGQLAAGRVVVNLFAYNGGFSVAAALGGAAHVTTVDIAPEAIEDAKAIFRLNDLDPRAHRFEVADVFRWAPAAPVDLLVVDPPSLARGKRSEHAATRAYRTLHERLGGFVQREGVLATSSCTARLDFPRWRDAVRTGLRRHGDWSWLGSAGEAADHPVASMHDEGHYLKFALLRRR